MINPRLSVAGRIGIEHRVRRNLRVAGSRRNPIAEIQLERRNPAARIPAAHRPAIDTTLSPAGADSDSSALREMSSLCSVMYFE